MFRALALALSAALAAPPASACSPLPPPPAGFTGCDAVRLQEGWRCFYDPSAPGGVRVEQVGASEECPPLPPCPEEGCARREPSFLAALLDRLGF